LLVDVPISAPATDCTHVNVAELVGEEGSGATIAGGVASIVVVAVKSIVLLALRAGPAELGIVSG
jgi:hypothetical protein